MPTKSKSKSKKSGGTDVIYAMVTDRIIDALKGGTVPWKKTWRVMGGIHYNLKSKIAYRGINPFLLDLTAMQKGFKSPYWLSYKQVTELGGEVMESERKEYTIVIFWKILENELDEIDSKTGKKKVKKVPLLRYYRVYNVEQTAGIDSKKIPTIHEIEQHEFKPVQRAEKALKGNPNAPKVKHTQSFNPGYFPLLDTVVMPFQNQFTSTEDYYATRFHEEVHATGHKDRLNRPGVAQAQRFGSDPYAEEELVAEMGSAMLGSIFNIEGEDQREQTAAYIKSWIARFEEDKKLLINAGGKAQKASEYLLGDLKKKD